jgi:SAM-dependent methyltransferase
MTEPSHLDTTRRAYDAVAVDYAALLRTSLAESPLDRALLNVLAELVLADGGGMVGDLGCGPGRVTAYLHERGLDAFGVDLSPGMVAVARESHPHLRFEVGSLDHLDLEDGSLAGAVVWYSLIHTPPEHQPRAFAELRRVLAPGGHLLLACTRGRSASRRATSRRRRRASCWQAGRRAGLRERGGAGSPGAHRSRH